MATRMWRKNGPILSVKDKKGYFDVQYGEESSAQKMDVFLPEGNGPFPVIVSIHGGGFVACDKRQKDMLEPMLAGLDKGFALVGVNYRLTDECKFPDPVKDIKRAIRYIKANAKNWNLNPDKMILWGGSAGGYLSLMGCLFKDAVIFDSEDDPNLAVSAQVAGGVIWYPVTDYTVDIDEELRVNSIIDGQLEPDLKDINEEEYEPALPLSDDTHYPYHNMTESALYKFLGCNLGTDNEIAIKASPMTYISDEMPPLLVQHGRRDQIIPVQQSVRFAFKANDFCKEERVKLEIIQDAIHSSVLLETEENINHIFEFIKTILKK